MIGSTSEEHADFIDYLVNVNPATLLFPHVRRAQELLARCNLNMDRVQNVCKPLAPFYLWVSRTRLILVCIIAYVCGFDSVGLRRETDTEM